MHHTKSAALCAALGFAALFSPALANQAARRPSVHALPRVDFNREVRPILAGSCFTCHGADDKARQAGLRLDTREGATARRSGLPAIVPGRAAQSRLLERLTTKVDALRMPPAATGKRLTPAQVETLRRWIDQGAKYQRHWAFVAPSAQLPVSRNSSWRRNPIDDFILNRMRREGLRPSPEADRYTLIRRVSLDLVGLPPTPSEIEAFVKDNRPGAYERLVDRLLASPHYGERWARRWLDVARYADTNGYEKDRERAIWPYRDWVIRALNADMPFDQFTIKQLAGDLLPNATADDLVATGFHRNTMQNEEGGIDIAEDRFKSLVDRVNTTGEAWLGLTVMCGQCHSHKYDPLTQREYYQLMSLLNNTDEVDYEIPDAAVGKKRAGIFAEIARLERGRRAAFPGGEPALLAAAAQWEEQSRSKSSHWFVLQPSVYSSALGATLDLLPDASILASGDKPNTDTYEVIATTLEQNLTGLRLEVMADPSLPDGGPGRAHFFARGGFLLSEVKVDARPASGGEWKPVTLEQPTADFEAKGRTIGQSLDGRLDTGWMISGEEGRDHRAVFRFAGTVGFRGGTQIRVRLDQFYVHQCTIGRFRLAVTNSQGPSATTLPADIEAALCRGASGDDPSVLRYFLQVAPELKAVNQRIAELRRSMPAFQTTLALRERPSSHPRVTRVHQRGEFLKPAEPVRPKTPAFLPAMPAEYPRNRLGLARWLVDGRNPLTARVVVNREWQAFFGRGLVSTLEDFGLRGDPPTHPDLLDWLAMEFASPSPLSPSPGAAPLPPNSGGSRPDDRRLGKGMAGRYALAPLPPKSGGSGPDVGWLGRIGSGPMTRIPPPQSSFTAQRVARQRRCIGNPPQLGGRGQQICNSQFAICNLQFPPALDPPALGGRGAIPPEMADTGARHSRAASASQIENRKSKIENSMRWSLKALHRLIVTSATYRQSARVTPEMLAKDPENRFYARAPRFRVDAEIVRDIALQASGLLNPAIGGPSVRPPQPPEVTAQVYGGGSYETSKGPDRYRRGLYTHWKRTAPFAAFVTFDAPTSETTCLRRVRSNTPLQALTLLNDEVFVEAAQALAQRAAKEGGESPDSQIDYLYLCALSRKPSRTERDRVRAFFEEQAARFQHDETAIGDVAFKYRQKPPDGANAAELAAWTLVSRALLNLDEAITRQ